MKRLFYTDLNIGDTVRVQAYYGRVTQNFYTGVITNMDGQNIVVKVDTREHNEPIVDGSEIKLRNHEACNPEAAIVEAA